MNVEIKAFINGIEISRTKILEWEKQRAKKVLAKLRVKPSGDDLSTMRRQLIQHKQNLGVDGIFKRLSFELDVSDITASLTALLSAGKRRFSITELVSSHGSAEQFVSWFNEQSHSSNELPMIEAAPDHYIIRLRGDGSQEVVETTGGSPLVTRFYIDYNDISSLRSHINPAYPLQIAGVARSRNGIVLGGVRHQFRDEGKGFRAHLLVEYPSLILPGIIKGHQWHLACEFSNWIEAYLRYKKNNL